MGGSYNCVINACALQGDVKQAEQWLEWMCKAGMKPDNLSYNSVINACARKGDVKQAEQWLERMCMACMKPTAPK